MQVHHKLIIIVPLALTAWLTVTFWTKPEPIGTLINFYKRVQPGGWWGPISQNFTHTMQPVTTGFFYQWIAGIMMIYGFTFGIGNLIFMNYSEAVVLIGLAILGAYLIWNRSISKLS